MANISTTTMLALGTLLGALTYVLVYGNDWGWSIWCKEEGGMVTILPRAKKSNFCIR